MPGDSVLAVVHNQVLLTARLPPYADVKLNGRHIEGLAAAPSFHPRGVETVVTEPGVVMNRKSSRCEPQLARAVADARALRVRPV